MNNPTREFLGKSEGLFGESTFKGYIVSNQRPQTVVVHGSSHTK